MTIRKLSDVLEELARTAYRGLMPHYGHELCEACNGTGFAHDDPCPCCDGVGDVFIEEPSTERPIKVSRHCNSEQCQYVDELGFCACGCPDCRSADEKLSQRNEVENE